MAHKEIENILRRTIGLKPSSIGETVINRAVHHRMQDLNITQEDDYIKKLIGSPLELRELIEEVVVHETWFFRDSEPFNALADFVLKTWNPAHPKELLRILSAPCSTGEEPYSVAMALLQAGLPEHRFSVDAVDISNRAIAKAKEALYAEKSFRTADLAFRHRYFRREGDQYQLLPLVARKVHFIHGNIVDPSFLARLGLYDVIFCRNLLIYLDARHQRQLVDNFHQFLAQDGLLITGHSEAAIFTTKKFRPLSQERTFAFFKTTTQRLPAAKPRQVSGKTAPATEKSAHGAVSSPPAAPSAAKTPSPAVTDPKGILARAKEQADLGNLAEATALCEEHLQKHGPSAEGYFLLGLIKEGQDDSPAAYDLFRKALYVSPDHVDSLIHLSYLADKIGNPRGAANYRRRAAKLMEQE